MPVIASLLALLLGQQASDPARVFDYDREASLDFRVASEERVDGVTVQDVSYVSARKGRVPSTPSSSWAARRPGAFSSSSRSGRFVSEASARDYVEAAGGSHQVRWYFTSHEFNDGQSPLDRMAFLKKKLALSP